MYGIINYYGNYRPQRVERRTVIVARVKLAFGYASAATVLPL